MHKVGDADDNEKKNSSAERSVISCYQHHLQVDQLVTWPVHGLTIPWAVQSVTCPVCDLSSLLVH